jgi:hypothetical protein
MVKDTCPFPLFEVTQVLFFKLLKVVIQWDIYTMITRNKLNKHTKKQ